MIKYKIIWNGEQLETRFNTRSEAECFASERYNIEKDEVDNGRANDKNGTFWEDYPEYEIEAYETSVRIINTEFIWIIMSKSNTV